MTNDRSQTQPFRAEPNRCGKPNAVGRDAKAGTDVNEVPMADLRVGLDEFGQRDVEATTQLGQIVPCPYDIGLGRCIGGPEGRYRGKAQTGKRPTSHGGRENHCSKRPSRHETDIGFSSEPLEQLRQALGVPIERR